MEGVMKNVKRETARLVLYAGMAGSMILPSFAVGGATPAAAQGQSRNLGPSNIPVAGRFLEVWSHPGSDQNSVYVNGYPITQRRAEISLTDGKVYDTQW